MYHVSSQGVDERMINVHYYYYSCRAAEQKEDTGEIKTDLGSLSQCSVTERRHRRDWSSNSRSLSQTIKRTEDTETTSKQVTISEGQIEDTRENEAQIRGHCHRTVEQTEDTERISKLGH